MTEQQFKNVLYAKIESLKDLREHLSKDEVKQLNEAIEILNDTVEIAARNRELKKLSKKS